MHRGTDELVQVVPDAIAGRVFQMAGDVDVACYQNDACDLLASYEIEQRFALVRVGVPVILLPVLLVVPDPCQRRVP